MNLRILGAALPLAGLAAIAGCVGGATALDPIFDSTPPENGAYQLEGEAVLATGSGVEPQLRQERLTLFVDASGAPTQLRNRLTEDTNRLNFPAGATISDDVCGHTGCLVRVERATGCAVFDYDNYFPPSRYSDTGYAYTGRVRACPTREVFVPVLTTEGGLVADTLLPTGRLRIRANFPFDLAVDTFETTIDGVPQTAVPAFDGDQDSLVLELGTVPIGADFTVAYTGPRPVSPVAPSTFATTAELTDFSLATAPPAGAIDSRGTPLVYAPGSLSIRDAGRNPRVPFAFLIALGDPGVATRLRVDATFRYASGGFSVAALVRADGTSSGSFSSDVPPEVPVPPGAGPLWLLITNDQSLLMPTDIADQLVIDIHSLQWVN